jgi:hypothetical protein
MKTSTHFLSFFLPFFLVIAGCLAAADGYSQSGMPSIPPALYVSPQTGEFSTYHGSASKTTDKYEHGTLTIETKGPISAETKPADLSIGTSQTKSWTGTITPQKDGWAPAGQSVTAQVIGHFDTYFSRPSGSGAVGAVIESYYCATEGSTGDGCAYHGGNRGKHDIIHYVGDEAISIEVYSVSIKIKDIACSSEGVADEITLNADVFPSGGVITWNTPLGPATGNGVKISGKGLPDNFQISAVYTIEGVSASDSKKVMRNKLVGLTIPCCVDTVRKTKDIAVPTFDGPCHPFVFYTPEMLSPPAVLMTSTQKVTATSSSGETVSQNVELVNSNKSISKTPVQINFGQKVGEAVDHVLDAVMSGGPVNPCSKSGGFIPSGGINTEEMYICCPGTSDCVKKASKIAGQLTWNFGVTCQFPIPALSIPYVASVDAVVSAGFSAGIGVSYQSTCTSAGKICAEAEAKLSFGGGIGLTFLAGAAQGNAQLVCDAVGVKGTYCFTPPPAAGTGTITFGKIKVVGNLSLAWGLTSHSIEYTLFDGWPAKTFTF